MSTAEGEEPDNPFPGLRPFERGDAKLFFGRDGQSDELLRRLVKTRFVAVVGDSGSGKSSLVRAGLLPALYGGVTTSGSDWCDAVMRPGGDVMGNLARALDEASKPRADAYREQAELQPALFETLLRRSSLGLVESFRQLKKVRREPFANLLLVVDQFEELFRFGADGRGEAEGEAAEQYARAKDLRAAFVRLLLQATGQRELPVYVILTMRSEYLGACSQFGGLPEAINEGQYLIPRMTRDERRQAIEGPVGVRRARISQFLVNRLLNEAGDRPEKLPTLQHALMRTWDDWRASGAEEIGVGNYNNIGGMGEALSRHGDEVYGKLDGRQQGIAETLFKALVEVDQKNQQVRRPAPLGAVCRIVLGESGGETSERDLKAVALEVIPVVEAFRGRNISFLNVSPNVGLDASKLDAVIDISHESLIEGWATLRVWAREEAEAAKVYARLADTAALHREGRAGLYRGRDLRIASEWRRQFRPSEAWAARYHAGYRDALRFLRKSERQRAWTILMALVVAAAVVVVAALYARTQRRIAESERLAANSARELANDPQAALKLAADAVRTSPTAHAEEALRNALFASENRVLIPPVVGEGGRRYGAVSSALSPDGRYVLTANRDGKAYLWDWEDAERPAARFDHTGGLIASAAFNTPGDRVVTTGENGKAFVWEVNPANFRPTGNFAELRGHTGTVNAAAFSPDGRHVATAGADGTARVWDLGDGGRQVAEFKHEPPPTAREGEPEAYGVRSIAFDPEGGRYILTTSGDGAIRLWDWNGKGNRTFSYGGVNHLGGYFTKAVFSADGKYILTADNRFGASVWARDADREKLTLGREYALFRRPGVLDAEFDPTNPRRIVTASTDKVARVWEWDESPPPSAARTTLSATDTVYAAREGRVVASLGAHADWVVGASFSRDGRAVLTTSYDGLTTLWRDIFGRNKLERFFAPPTQKALSVAFDPDNPRLTLAIGGKTLRVLDVDEATERDRYLSGDILDLAFSPRGSYLAAATRKGEVAVIAMGGRYSDYPLRPTAQAEAVNAVAFSPDGRSIATGGDDKMVRVWSRAQNATDATGELSTMPVDAAVNGLAFSRDGKMLVGVCGDGKASVWVMSDAGEWKQSVVWDYGDTLRTVAIAPDGTIALAGDDGVIPLRAGVGIPFRYLTAYEGSVPVPVFKVEFSRDGKYLVSAGYDNTVRVWEVSTGTRLATIVETSDDPDFLKGQTENPLAAGAASGGARARLLTDVALSPDGKYIAAARADRRPVHVYSWFYFRDSADLLREAEKRISQ